MVETLEPLCPVFGTCGGCAYQHLPYEEELKVKEIYLKELLRKRLDLKTDVIQPVVASPAAYHSRSRLDLTMRRTNKGEVLLGFMPANSKKIVTVDACAIARREISDFIPTLHKEAAERLPANYRTANLVIKTGDDGRVYWGGIGRHSLRMQPEDYLWTEVRGRRIYYSLETFFQANLSILPSLMDRIESLLPPPGKRKLFLDLYAGVGLFGIALADLFEKIVMLEENPASVKIGRYSIEQHGLKHIEALDGRVEEHLAEILSSAGGCGELAAMIDPPRKGLSESTVNMLKTAHQIEYLFYLSCHPESLARDLEILLGAGWRISQVVPFDFFPKTQHLETLVLLRPPAVVN